MMEAGFWISVVVLLAGIFVTTFVSWSLTKKTIERVDQRTRETIERVDQRTKETIERTVTPLAKVTASIKTEVRSIEKKGSRRK